MLLWFLLLITFGLVSGGDRRGDNSITKDLADINFYFYDNNDPSDGLLIDSTSSFLNSSFDASRNTVFVTHGWTEFYRSDVCQLIKDALLKKNDVNVIIVDWSRWTLEAFDEVVAIGGTVSSFIRKHGLQLDKTSLVGFSVGAQIMGIAGRDLDGQCDQVIGLDPVGPGYYFIRANDRLNTSSGKFVHVIHTDGDQFGMYQALGHADYYPNGGKTQAGCEWEIIGVCGHLRSVYFYVESILTGNFRAMHCDSYSDFETQKCSGDVSYMGGYPVDKRASGIYFLDTNREPPFAKG